jgi:hypothetical protein
MLPQLFEPYRRERGTWDTWAHIGLTAAVSGKTGEALVIGVIIVVIAGIIWANAYLLHTTAKYLWYVYTTRTWGKDRASRALQAISIGAVVVWVLSFVAYRNGDIDYALHVDILGVSFLLFALGVTQIEKRETQRGQQGTPQLAGAASSTKPSNVPNARNFLGRRKSK